MLMKKPNFIICVLKFYFILSVDAAIICMDAMFFNMDWSLTKDKTENKSPPEINDVHISDARKNDVLCFMRYCY